MKGTNPNHQAQGRYHYSGHPESRPNYSLGTCNHNNIGEGFNKSSNDSLQATGQSTSRELREAPICLRFNKFERAYCELPQNKCQNNRLHKCQTCGRWGSKSRNHSQHMLRSHYRNYGEHKGLEVLNSELSKLSP